MLWRRTRRRCSKTALTYRRAMVSHQCPIASPVEPRNALIHKARRVVPTNPPGDAIKNKRLVDEHPRLAGPIPKIEPNTRRMELKLYSRVYNAETRQRRDVTERARKRLSTMCLDMLRRNSGLQKDFSRRVERELGADMPRTSDGSAPPWVFREGSDARRTRRYHAHGGGICSIAECHPDGGVVCRTVHPKRAWTRVLRVPL